MLVTIDMTKAVVPKRGDLLHTNVGDKRERTFIILSSRPLRPIKGYPRYKVWAERWWEMEPELRVKLFQSAERNGGQMVIHFQRYPAKKKPTFDQHISRSR